MDEERPRDTEIRELLRDEEQYALCGGQSGEPIRYHQRVGGTDLYAPTMSGLDRFAARVRKNQQRGFDWQQAKSERSSVRRGGLAHVG